MARPRLTQQQRARIAQTRQARRLRQADASVVQSETEAAEQRGRVIVRHGQTVVVDAGGESVLCALRQHLDGIACGDHVRWQATEAEKGVVLGIEPRTNVLSRPAFNGQDKPLAANITQLIVVLAVKPKVSGYLLDQYLIVAAQLQIRAVICLNKADLLSLDQQADFRARFAHYAALGHLVIQVSCKVADGLQPLRALLVDHTSILVGQSGVGKSSLINALSAQSATVEGELSAATGLGRHTTSASTLYPLVSGGELIDSPGVRSFRLGKLTRPMLECGYPELSALLGLCRFNDCQHQAEPGCAVQASVAEGAVHPNRLASFQHMAQQLV